MQFNLRTNGHLGYALFGLIAVSVSILVASEVGHSRAQASYEHVIREMTASAKLSTLLGFATDAEASQRGYLLTDRDEYLDVYKQVLPKIDPLLTELREVYVDPDDPSLLTDFDALANTLHEKLSELDTTLAMAQDGKKQQAKDMFLTDIGKEKMDQLRAKAAKLQTRERERTAKSITQRQVDHQLSRLAVAVVTVLNVILSVFLFRWLRTDWAREQRRQQVLTEQRTQLDRLVAERTSQLEILASHLQQVSENEKSSIARELHDELGAILTASKMDVSWVRQNLTADQTVLNDKLARALKYLDQGVQAKRRLIENLMPSTLTSFGLVVALRELAENMQARTEWALTLDFPDESLVLPDEPSIALFRIAQESINNAAKYASAKAVLVRLVREGDVVLLEIEDNGNGFDASHMRPKSHGLAGMRQRMIGLGGTLQVDSHVGKGTRVRARLTIPPESLLPDEVEPEA